MNRVEVTLHGVLAEQVGRSKWSLVANNVKEAISGIQSSSKKLYSNLIKNDAEKIKYRVLINGDDFFIEEGQDPNTREGLKSSQLCLEKVSRLKTIDIIPVIEGSDDWMDWFTVILGVALIWIGAPMIATAGWGSMYGMAVVAGIGLVAAGVANLLTPDPEFDDFREIEGGGRPPYAFSGPLNVIKEGGPVFVGYGRLLVGSQVIQTSTDHFDEDAGVAQNDSWGSSSYGLRYNVGDIEGKVLGRVSRLADPLTP